MYASVVLDVEAEHLLGIVSDQYKKSKLYMCSIVDSPAEQKCNDCSKLFHASDYPLLCHSVKFAVHAVLRLVTRRDFALISTR